MKESLRTQEAISLPVAFAVGTVWAALAVTQRGNHDLDALAKSCIAGFGTCIVLALIALKSRSHTFSDDLKLPCRDVGLLFISFVVLSFVVPLVVFTGAHRQVHILPWFAFSLGPVFGVCVFFLGAKAKQAIVLMALGCVPVALIALCQMLFGSGPLEIRATSTMANPNTTAAVTLFGAVFFAFLAQSSRNRRRLYMVGSIVCILGTIATVCKTGIVSLVLASLVMGFFPRLKKMSWGSWLAVFVGLELFICLGAVLFGSNNGAAYTGLSGRFLIWRSAMNVMAQTRFLGTGLGQWQPGLMHAAAGIVNSGHAAPLLHAPNFVYNDVLGLALSTGIVPALLFVALLARLCGAVRFTHDHPAITAAFAVIPVLFLFGLTQSPLINPAVSLMFWAIFGAIAQETGVTGKPGHSPWGFVRGAFAVLAVIVFVNAVRLGAAASLMIKSRALAGHPDSALQAADAAILSVKIMPENATAQSEAADRLARARRFPEALLCLDKSLEMSLSYASLFKKGDMLEWSQNPEAAFVYWKYLAGSFAWLLTPHYRMALFLEQQGKIDEARVECRQAVALPVYSGEQERMNGLSERLLLQLQRH